jgi:Kef-type K+ transport system membrane component KefB
MFKRFFLFFGLFLILPSLAFASAGESFHETTLLLLAIYLAAKILGVAAEKIGLPALVGEILGGIVLGNLAYLGVAHTVSNEVLHSPFFQYAAELGVIFLLFLVGLESNLKDLLKVGVNSFVTAMIGVILPTLGGFFVVKALGIGNTLEAMLFGATFAATSVGITAKILSEAKKLKTPSAQIVLGAAVVDDVLGLILLAALAGVAASGSFAWTGLAWILFKVVAFFALAIFFGQFVLPHGFRIYKKLQQPGFLTVLAIALALVFADLAYLVGLAPIVGAFTAGLLLDDVQLRHADGLKVVHFEEVIKPIMDFLLPIFFVSIGVQVRLATFGSLQNLFLITILLVVAILGKTVCGFACRGKGIDRFGIGLGMIPRGEVGLIFASFGLKQNIVSPEMYSILVSVVLLTTILGPMFLKFRLKKF